MILYGCDDCHTRHLGPAVLHTLEHLPCHILDVTTLFEDTGRAAEESIIQVSSVHEFKILIFIKCIYFNGQSIHIITLDRQITVLTLAFFLRLPIYGQLNLFTYFYRSDFSEAKHRPSKKKL